MNSTPCERCGRVVPRHDLTHYTIDTGTLLLCTHCFNADVAEKIGIENFDNHPLDPISITVSDGVVHEFHFRARLMGADMVALEAFELDEGEPAGYQFQLIGAPGEDRFTQLGRLVKRIRATLSTKYLEVGKYGLHIKDMEVSGRIEADTLVDGDLFGIRLPMLVIDGREITWEKLGEMLMTFEGFQFKLQIIDKSDDLES
jgi:hypothetical protein